MMLLRFAQYQDALIEDAAFHKRYMVTPLQVKDGAQDARSVATRKDDEKVSFLRRGKDWRDSSRSWTAGR